MILSTEYFMHAKYSVLSLITGLISATAFAEPAIRAGIIMKNFQSK